MCLIAFAIDAHPAYPLVVAANRDEFYARPTRRAAIWPGPAGIVAGRDEQAGGTWMGVRADGRWAAVTNFRRIGEHRPEAASRGDLVADYLQGEAGPEAYAREVHARGGEYNGFNLLLGTGPSLWYVSNRGQAPQPVDRGVHALSNHLLDTPWVKAERSARRLDALLAQQAPALEDLFGLLADPTAAPDERLPDTGLSRERERAVSSIFIASPDYGTRSSTVLLQDAHDVVTFVERTFDEHGAPRSTRRFRFPAALARGEERGPGVAASPGVSRRTQSHDLTPHG